MFISSKLHIQQLILIFLVYLLVLNLLNYFFGIEFKFILETLITLFAVFLGAFLAYAFNSGRQNIAERQNDIKNANLVLFSLIQFWNSLENYKKN